MLSNLSVDRFLSDKPLAITAAGLEELRGHIEARLAHLDNGPEALVEMVAAMRAERQGGSQRPTRGATGVIPIRGTISQHAQGDLSSFLMGGATTEGIAQTLREYLADDSIAKIVLDIDSPGGKVSGITELWSEIFRSRGEKPIIAVANSMAASAAYWLGSAADRFYTTPSGLVGSIGIIGIHQDLSSAAEKAGVKTTLITAGKYKAAGNQFEPLDDETRARAQTRIDDEYAQFVHDVARGRGVTESAVRGGYGEGDVLTAKRAKAEGMVDGILTLDQVIAAPPGRFREPVGSVALMPEEPDEQDEDTEATQRFRALRWQALQDQAALVAPAAGGN